MGSYREFEAGLQFGNAYFKLFKFVINEISKDIYLIFPITDVGLKLSIHSPKPPTYPTMHAHWSSHKLGIHEDVDVNIFSKQYLKELAMGFLESFRCCQPSSGEDVLVFPNFITDAYKVETLGKKERTRIDVERLMRTICKGTFYQTKAKKLPLLIREMKRKDPFLNLRGNFSILAMSNNRLIIPLSSKTMIELDHLTLMEKLRKTDFNSLFNPMEKTIKTISRTNPNAVQNWLPNSDINDFFERTMNTVNQLKPKIVTF